MIATPRFVFLHLHKSGGTFVNECLLRHVSQAQRLGYHLPRRLIPRDYAHLPVLGFVRSPWSYYVSWYTFQSGRQVPNPVYRTASDAGRLGFADTIRNLLTLGSRSPLLDSLLAALPASYTNRGLNLPACALADIRDSEQGFYSYLHDYMFGGGDDDTLRIGRMEHLRAELLTMLRHVGQPIDAAFEATILQAAPVNTSPHAAYMDYYDDALRDLVASHDHAVIARYRYRFGE